VARDTNGQAVFCLPGVIFDCPNYFRIVTTVPTTEMTEALDRIAAFCAEIHV
jgi:hypothetical protein